ncbi:MAG: hypothetical protein FWD93_02140 [Coriobacteriia bacterium]|nr:hypothetical protein [Coriobacteriia bacterium]
MDNHNNTVTDNEESPSQNQRTGMNDLIKSFIVSVLTNVVAISFLCFALESYVTFWLAIYFIIIPLVITTFALYFKGARHVEKATSRKYLLLGRTGIALSLLAVPFWTLLAVFTGML